MKDNERRAIVWDKIERLAFRPNSPAGWLGVYAKTLHGLWGVEPMWNRLALDDHFNVPFLSLICDYSIDSLEKYSVSLIADRCYWQNHIDPGSFKKPYFSKGALYSASSRFPHQKKEKLRKDVKKVLYGMIFHPRCHSHLEALGSRWVQLDQDRDGLSSKEVRIGGGIENPYVFLFHLRYQFCLVSKQARQTERQRLIDLFERAIRHKKKNVNTRELFDYKR